MNRRSFFARAFGFGAAVVMNHFLKTEVIKPTYSLYNKTFVSESFSIGATSMAMKEKFEQAIKDCWEDKDQNLYIKSARAV